MSPLIQARLAQLLVTSLYEDRGNGVLRLVEQIDMQQTPWFWPPIVEINCKQKLYPVVYPTGPGIQLKGPVQPNSPPSRWTDVVDQTEDGRTIIVGRIPHWDEFWSGSPPKSLRTEIPHSEVDDFLSSLMQGQSASAKVFFDQAHNPGQLLLPPKMALGTRYPIGSDSSGPLGPRLDVPIDFRPVTPPRTGNSSNCWERICCIGLDIERREVTAIVEVTQTAGYGGDPCNSRSTITVGFWLVEPSWAEVEPQQWESYPIGNENDVGGNNVECSRNVRFLGTSHIKVSDVPVKRSVIGAQTGDGFTILQLLLSQVPLHLGSRT